MALPSAVLSVQVSGPLVLSVRSMVRSMFPTVVLLFTVPTALLKFNVPVGPTMALIA